MARDNQATQPVAETQGMPIMVHLKEMRDRLIKSVIALVVTTSISLYFAEDIVGILKRPAGNIELISIEMIENLSVFFKVSLAGGIVLAMPILVYQLFAFIIPALTSKEKRYIFTMLPFIVFMFLCGIAFAYWVALPPALRFLTDFFTEQAETQIRISNYISFVTRLILGLGLVFETPVVVMFLARIGVVSPQWLAGKRKIWVVLAFVIAAIVTPTPDPGNQLIVAIPLILLLELSIFLSRFVYKKRVPPSEQESDD
ncbi:MAG: twin-arginine translocase subunit TatC [Dehalococcoidales bacterium]|nr:twin-arginine translocase subunit TatC [Dehalococcoidales bacterium]